MEKIEFKSLGEVMYHQVMETALDKENLHIKRIKQYIMTNLSNELTLQQLAEEVHLEPHYLCTLFKKETGITVTAYIIRQRINYAKHLLENTRLQIQTVALHCGLGDVHYFSKLFKKETGLTPREFRQSVQ